MNIDIDKLEALAGPPYTFDRYRNGVKMAEGVRIERERTLEDAMRSAARIAARKYPKGDVLVFSGCGVDGLLALIARLREAEAREQALSAHVERQARVIFDTLAAIEDGEPDAIPYDEARALYNDAPTTSLARLKAQWQAEALDEAAMDIRADYGHCTQYNVSLLASGVDGYANHKRRQAEQADTADTAGEGS